MFAVKKLRPFFTLANSFESSLSASENYSSRSKKTLHTEPSRKRLPPGFNAPTPFSLFVKEQTPKYPGLKVVDAIKLIAQEWKVVDNSKKLVYKSEYEKIAAERRQNFEDLPKSEKVLLEKKVLEDRKKNVLRKRRIINREINIATNRPKRPLSSYFLFLKEYTQKHGATVGNKSTLVIKAAANAWNNLNASEKENFEKQAKVDFEKYKIEIEKWKTRNDVKKLQEAHKDDMIRLSRKMTLIKLASEQDVKPVTPKKTSSNVTKSAASKKTNIKKKATTKTKVGKAIAKAKK